MPTGGFLVVGRTEDVLGVPVVSAMAGARHPEYPIHRSVDEAIDCRVIAEPTVFWGIPSFVRHFFRRARERGVNEIYIERYVKVAREANIRAD